MVVSSEDINLAGLGGEERELFSGMVTRGHSQVLLRGHSQETLTLTLIIPPQCQAVMRDGHELCKEERGWGLGYCWAVGLTSALPSLFFFSFQTCQPLPVLI